MNSKRKVRVRNGFSDRNMIRPISKEMQHTEFSSETRVVLFNSLKNQLELQVASRNLNKNNVAKAIVEYAFNDIYDYYKDSYDAVLKDVYDICISEEYHDVLTIIEFVCNLVYESREGYAALHGGDWYFMSLYRDIREEMNKTFENEFVGYRFVGEKIVPITNEAEIKTINEACKTPMRE